MFKRAVILLLLVITPFAQARAVLVCSMLNGQIVEHCHCPHEAGHAAPNRQDASEGACCDVVINVNSKDFAGVTGDQPTVKRAAHDPSDSPVIPVHGVIMPTRFAVARLLPSADVPSLPASRLYLRTARLRL